MSGILTLAGAILAELMDHNIAHGVIRCPMYVMISLKFSIYRAGPEICGDCCIAMRRRGSAVENFYGIRKPLYSST
jgi:hypothetical protein